MGIKLRYDAAAVALPSDQANRRFGQSLVMQQQQQKYQTQQAGYDRMFTALRDQNQNMVQQQRDWMQRDFALNRDKEQRDFAVSRDKLQFEQQQQLMEQQRQQQFMDEARKASSGMIINDIQNGHYDPVTAGKLQQSLVTELETLGDPKYDATQRAEALAKLRSERALLMEGRMEIPDRPTAQDNFDQRVVNGPDGSQYIQNGKGDFVPLQPKQQQQPQRPQNAIEFYTQNQDQMQKDVAAELKSLQEQADLGTLPKGVTADRDTAWKNVQDNYNWRQKQLGLIGEPTLAPPLPGSSQQGQDSSPSSQPAPYGQTLKNTFDAYHNDKSDKNYQTYRDAVRSHAILRDLMDKANSLPEGSQEQKEAWILFRKERDKIMAGVPEEKQVQAQAQTPQTQNNWADASGGSSQQGQNGSTLGDASSDAWSMGEWKDLANQAGDGRVNSPSTQSQPAQQQSNQPNAPQNQSSAVKLGDASNYPWLRDQSGNTYPVNTTSQSQQPASVPAPDFTALASSAQDDIDRALIHTLGNIYQTQPPDVQAAIGKIIDPKASHDDARAAEAYLRSKGINVNQLINPVQGNWDAMKSTNRSLSGVR